MNNNKLPVFNIFSRAMVLPLENYRPLLKAGLPLIITLFIGTIYGHFVQNTKETTLYTAANIIYITAYYITLTMAIVGCHRIFIIGSSVADDIGPFEWTGNEIKYAGWWILIGLFAGVIGLPLVMLLALFSDGIMEYMHSNPALTVIVFSIIYSPIVYIISRWSLVLPSAAIGKHGKSISWSWQLSDNNGVRLTILIGFLPVLLNLILELLPTYESLIYTLTSTTLWLFVGAVEVCLLSLSYSFFASADNGSLLQQADDAITEEKSVLSPSDIIENSNGTYSVGGKEFTDIKDAEAESKRADLD